MARRLEIQIVGDASRLQKEFNKAARSARVFNAQITGSFRNFSRGLGFAAGAAGVASIGLALRSTINAAIDFESSFAGVRKTVDATEPQLRALARGFREMSKEIPVSVDELNRIGEAAGQLGIQRGAILQFTETVAALGVTTNLASDQAADALARIANITQIPQDEFDRLGSTVVDLGNKLAATESEIVDFGLRIAAAGKIVGLTVDQTLAVAGAFTSVGVEAEAGGTAVSKVFIALANATKTGGKQLDLFARTAGTSTAEFRRRFERDAAGAFLAFTEGLKRVDTEGGNVFKTLSDLGLTDQRLTRAFLSISQSGDLLRRSLEVGSKAWRENNALTIEAEKRYATAASRLQVFKNRVNDLQITLGAALVPALEDIIAPLSEWIEKTENQKRAQKALTDIVGDARQVIAGVKDVVVPLAQAAGVLTEKFGGLRRTVELLLIAMVATKVTAFAASLTGLGATAVGTTGKVNALRFALLRLGAIGLITIGIEVLLNKEQISSAVNDFLRKNKLGFLTGEQIEIPAGISAQSLQIARDQLAAVKGDSDLAVKALDKAIARLTKAGRTGKRPDDQAGPRGPGAIEATNAIRRLKEQKRALEVVGKAQQDVADTFVKTAKTGEGAANKARAAFEKLMASLDLKLQRAATSVSFEDDLKVLRDEQKAVVARIRVVGRTAELEQMLLDIERRRIDILRERNEARKQAQKAGQFKALGLTETGDQRTPGVSALKKRLSSLKEQVAGTFLDTDKTQTQLERIRKVLAGKFGKVGRDIRGAILQMLNDIAGALDDKGETTGKLTAHRITDPNKILEGLGLTPEQQRLLNSRLISRSAGGNFRTTRGQSAFGFATGADTGTSTGPGGGFVINGPITVIADDPDAFIREVQKRTRRATKSRGGRLGGNRGL